MADIVKEVVDHNESLTEIASNATSKIPTTPEEMAVAYGSFVIMALLAIYFGSFRSLKAYKEQKVSNTHTVL
jgi:minor histocompatibility antigen H13